VTQRRHLCHFFHPKKKKEEEAEYKRRKTLNTPVTLSIKVKSNFLALFVFNSVLKKVILRKNSIISMMIDQSIDISVGPWKCQTEGKQKKNNKK
jgi:hypothetical protein